MKSLSRFSKNAKATAEAEPVCATVKQPMTYLSSTKQVLLSAIISALVATIGSIIASFITINYIEKYKAEETLRTFAFIEVYQPFRARLKSCHDVKVQALLQSSLVHFTNKQLKTFISSIAKSEKSSEMLQLLTTQLEELLNNYTKASVALSKSYIEIPICEREIERAGLDLATVLGLDATYQKLILSQAEKRPKQDFSKDGNVLARIVLNPELVEKLIKAFEDAQSGDKVRGMSFINKLRSQLEKSLKDSQAQFNYQSTVVQYGLAVEQEFANLFLQDFRARFNLKPNFLKGE